MSAPLRRVVGLVLSALPALAAACSGSGSDPIVQPRPATDPIAPEQDAGPTPPGFGSTPDSGKPAACEPPDLLIVLDRSASMRATADGSPIVDTPAGRASTKWGVAVAAVRAATAAPRDTTIRFGLELFPKQEPQCKTLSQLVQSPSLTNPSCETGEVLVPPKLSASSAIASSISQDTTPLCVSTPTTSAATLAETELAKIKSTRKQYLLIVTDGGETCGTDVVPVLQRLAANGVQTFVVGFSAQKPDGGAIAGVDRVALNDMACAGQTAKGFPAGCKQAEGGAGFVAADPRGAALYFDVAGAGPALAKAFDDIGKSVCCDCVR